MDKVLAITSPVTPGRVMVISDTQFEETVAPEILDSMLAFIIDQQPDIVIGCGDIIEGNSSAFWTNWERAKAFFDALTAAGIDWVAAVGNHDYVSLATREELFNANISLSTTWTRKDAGHIENVYKVVSLGGQDWLVLVLEWSPRTATVEWANSIVSQHADIPAILVTHAYMYSDGTRYDRVTYGTSQPYGPYDIVTTPEQGISDGGDLWRNLVQSNENVCLVLCGHIGSPPGPMVLSDTRVSGKVCHQITNCYQDEKPWGAGWLVKYEIDHRNNEVVGVVYSPYLRRTKTGTQSNDIRLKI